MNAGVPSPARGNGARIGAAVGIVGAIATLPLHFLLSDAQSLQFSAVVVAFVGAVYCGFALQRGSLPQIAVEFVVAFGFLGAALLGLWVEPLVIPAAFVAHGAWDALHHQHQRRLVPIPHWYPPFCALYDWIYALGLLAIWHQRGLA